MGNRRCLGLHLVFVSVFLSATTYSCLGVRNTSAVCFEEERLALLKFKESVQDRFGMLSSWVGNDCCRWERIKCNSVTRHVESLHLGGDSEDELFRKRLSGNEVSSSLADLRHLKYLDMSWNHFQGSRIPKFIGSLKQLTYLNLSKGGFQGIIPHHIGNLSNLEVLDLSLNQKLMIDDIAWTFGLSSLKHLDLSWLNLERAKHADMVLYMIPSLEELSLRACGLYISYLGPTVNSSRILPNIKHLDLGFNYIKGSSPRFLQNMTSLTLLDLSGIDLSLSWNVADLLNLIPSVSELHLSDCGLSNTHLSSHNLNFSTLSNIQHLDLSSNWIGGVFPLILTNMSSLRVLNILGNMLNSSVPIMPNLLELDLSRNKFKQIEQVGIWRRCHLRKLGLAWNYFELEMIDSLKNTSECVEYALEMLDLSGSFYGTIPRPLGRLTNLRILKMSSCKLTGPIPESITSLRFLEVLYLYYNQLTGPIPESITSLRFLEVLYLFGNQLTGPIPTFLGSLSDLDLSYNQLSGSIPESLGRLVSLQAIFLSSNRLNGSIPMSILQLSKLHSLDISNNFLEGVLFEAHFAKLLKLKYLYISSNHGLRLKVSDGWVPPFQLVSLSSCNIGSKFPQWIQNQRTLFDLTLSNATISGPLPTWLRKMSINYLDLSRNKLTGPLTNIPSGKIYYMPEDYYSTLFLEDNLFNESIPRSLCKRTDLVLLDLSKNRLKGKIPNCLANLQKLEMMKFSSNRLSGVIPRSIFLFSSSLAGLKLNENKLSGELPRELGDLYGLELLDLSDNEFVGNIPKWIGVKLPYLMVLRLRGNNFIGGIPRSVCKISELQILDVAFNNLTGTIPHCLGGLSAMVYTNLSADKGISLDDSYENVNQVVKGVDREYTTNWKIVFNMDLSSNKLVGGIPIELTALSMLMGLNLSNNHLSGCIPENIGNMTNLESLDFSNNNLTGIIPPTMAALNFLSHLNLSHNNLSGQIPTGRQLQTLDDPSIYAGNKDLCGPPLSKNCSSHEDSTATPNRNEAPDKPMKILFYVDVMCGFATGFWGIIGVLLFKKQWRQKLFMFAEETMDKIYVAVVVRVAKMKRGREAA